MTVGDNSHSRLGAKTFAKSPRLLISASEDSSPASSDVPVSASLLLDSNDLHTERVSNQFGVAPVEREANQLSDNE